MVEAADIALQRAPGRLRRFAFQKLREFDALSWEALQNEARLAEKPLCKLAIAGSDRDAEMIRVTRHNLELAGLATAVDTKVQDILDVRPTAPHGLIVSNPPYGVRLDEQDALAAWYPQLGTWLKNHFCLAGRSICSAVTCALAKLIHLSPKRRTPLYNGSLECRLFMIQMVAGSARREKPSADKQE
ncbi:hypothetical protein [Paludibacterium denitrificans]|uniref:hypothetical protein n=1 Tax=Paludibacterium denitrificans TaxID=2675226 RepID=UPI0035E435A5